MLAMLRYFLCCFRATVVAAFGKHVFKLSQLPVDPMTTYACAQSFLSLTRLPLAIYFYTPVALLWFLTPTFLAASMLNMSQQGLLSAALHLSIQCTLYYSTGYGHAGKFYILQCIQASIICMQGNFTFYSAYRLLSYAPRTYMRTT